MNNTTLTNKQALAMLDLQGQMNSKVNPNWIQAGYPFLRAVLVEGGEAIDHHGWKWWKAQEKDIDQLMLELVDIFHFTLSHLIIQAHGNIEEAARQLVTSANSADQNIDFDGASYTIHDLDTVRKLELMMGMAVSRRVSIKLFGTLLEDCGMTWADLYRQYVGKNVLNFFRQDNGYKAGTYRKEWAGREDNVHLVEIMASIDATTSNFRELLYEQLAARYVETADCWTAEDSAAAHPQGWNLFESSVDIDGETQLLIQRCDELEIFDDDFEALEFVKQAAAKGDALAAKALRLDSELAQGS